MTFNEMWKQFHGNCKDSYVKVEGQNVTFHCPVHNVTTVERAPYPFCRTPRECAGIGSCRREMACDD